MDEKNKNCTFSIPVSLGLDAEGNNQSLDLLQAPNLLIAGTADSGKDSFVESLIRSVFQSAGASDVRVAIANLAGKEMDCFNTDVHMMASAIHKVNECLGVMDFLSDETERRAKLFTVINAKKISEYNELIAGRPELGSRLPYLVFVIDEIAGPMKLQRLRFDRQIRRITAISRFVGIHLVFATSNVSPDVITPVLYSNFPTAIAFRLENKYQSKMILNRTGAEELKEGEMMWRGNIKTDGDNSR